MFTKITCWFVGHDDEHIYNLYPTLRHQERSEWRCTRCKRIELRPGHWPPTPPATVTMSPEQAEVTRCAVRAWQYLEDHQTKENFLLRVRLKNAISAVGLEAQSVGQDVPELPEDANDVTVA